MPDSYFGLPGQAVAVLMIVFGVLVIVFPNILSLLVGILLIVLGALALMSGTSAWGSWTRRDPGAPGEPPRRV